MLKINKSCTGCCACVSICPKKCIEMKMDKEGFPYPYIDASECVNCHLCEKVCQKEIDKGELSTQLGYACYHEDKLIQKQSSSGGVFFALAQWVLEKSGVVFGAAFDDNLILRHVSVVSIDAVKKLQGSKYVQSLIGNTYVEAEKFLEMGRWVLFSGTSCQITGLKKYLRKTYKRLITIDFLCHGVPSPGLLEEYFSYCEKKAGARIDTKNLPNFRDKSIDWRNYSIKIFFENGEEYSNVHYEDWYMRLFLENYSLRLSCYQCPFSSGGTCADITLGDFWKIDKIYPSVYDKDGVSCIFINSKLGQNIWEGIKMSFHAVEIEKVELERLKASYSGKRRIPWRRKYLFKHFKKMSFECLCVNVRKTSFLEKVIRKAGRKFSRR